MRKKAKWAIIAALAAVAFALAGCLDPEATGDYEGYEQ